MCPIRTPALEAFAGRAGSEVAVVRAQFAPPRSHASILLDILAGLCKHDETAVRMAAVESMNKIGAEMMGTPELVKEHITEKAKAMAKADWWSSRVSACGLIATSYKSCSDAESRKEIINLYCVRRRLPPPTAHARLSGLPPPPRRAPRPPPLSSHPACPSAPHRSPPSRAWSFRRN